MNIYDNNSEDNTSPTSGSTCTKYKGVRQRKWGKWVSEIRVPGSQARLWLGSYSTPEAAAVAHDVAFYCLRRPDSLHGLNFPLTLPLSTLRHDMSPRSVQQAASDAGLAVDAHHQAEQFSSAFPPAQPQLQQQQHWPPEPASDGLSISVEDYL